MRRIFIAINLSEQIKNQLVSEQKNIENLFSFIVDENSRCPIRWTKKNNLHITLDFIGNCSDAEIAEICNSVKSVCKDKSSFKISLNEICLGPSEKLARMVWVKGETPKELEDIRKNINFSSENRAFNLHITLGRIIQWQWRQIEPEEMPDISKEISLNFKVDSIDVMESKLKPRGPEYTILQSVKLF